MATQHKNKPSRPDAAALLVHAHSCLLLAESATDYWVAASLKELADLYFGRVDRLAHSQARRRNPPDIKSDGIEPPAA
jgi:hypothetical protein